MICFRDMTFCPYWRDCDLAEECRRPLTDAVRAEAAAWWGEGKGEPPIMQYASKPTCHVQREAGR